LIPSSLISLIERLGGRTGILAYHGVGEGDGWRSMHVSAMDFRRQLEMVVNRYRVLRLTEYVDRVRRGASVEGCVAVTFDDAYVGVVTDAGPVLREMQVPATVFVTSEVARHGKDFWWDRFFEVVHGPDRQVWDRLTREAGLDGLDRDDPEAVGLVREDLLARHAGRVELPDVPRPAEIWRSATFAELRAFAEWDGVDYGIHTRTHPVLPLLPAADRAREITDCADTLRENIPRVVPLLAYPYGFFDLETARIAASAGMAAAFSIEGFAPPRKPHLHAIPRIGLGSVHPNSSIRLRLSRLMRRPLMLRNGSGLNQLPRVAEPGPAR
jgi:peptidoglycan/xylan/chitin deacetylase (PgdA/CDA1 family)